MGATLRLAAPLVLTNLAQIAMMATDTIMIGRLGPAPLAAAALGTSIYFFLWMFAFGVAMATSPIIAQARGRNPHAVKEVRRSVRQGLWATAAVSVPFCVLMWMMAPLFRLAGQDEALIALAMPYLTMLLWGFLPSLWFVVLRCFVAALERPSSAAWITGGAILLNALVNYVLIYGRLGMPRLELMGAGLASTISNLAMLGALVAVIGLDRRFRRYRLLGRWWRSDWPRFRAIFQLGLPIAITLALECGVFSAAVLLMGVIGAADLAAHQIAIQIAATTFMVPLGIAQAATVRVALAVGRGDHEGVRRAGWVALAVGVGFMAAMAVVLWTTPHLIVHIYLDGHAPGTLDVLAKATAFLAVAALFQIADGAQAIGAGALRGLKDTAVPMLFALIGYWAIGFAACVALAFWAGLGGVGVWLGLALGLGATAVLMVTRFARRERLGLVYARP